MATLEEVRALNKKRIEAKKQAKLDKAAKKKKDLADVVARGRKAREALFVAPRLNVRDIRVSTNRYLVNRPHLGTGVPAHGPRHAAQRLPWAPLTGPRWPHWTQLVRTELQFKASRRSPHTYQSTHTLHPTFINASLTHTLLGCHITI